MISLDEGVQSDRPLLRVVQSSFSEPLPEFAVSDSMLVKLPPRSEDLLAEAVSEGAKIIKWRNGQRSLHIGERVFRLLEREDQVNLIEWRKVEGSEISVGIPLGVCGSQLTAIPLDTASSQLSRDRAVLLVDKRKKVTVADPTIQSARSASGSGAGKAGRGGSQELTAEFLEEGLGDSDAEGGSPSNRQGSRRSSTRSGSSRRPAHDEVHEGDGDVGESIRDIKKRYRGGR